MEVAIKDAIDDKLLRINIAFDATTFCDHKGAFDVQLTFNNTINLDVAFYFEFSANSTAFGDES